MREENGIRPGGSLPHPLRREPPRSGGQGALGSLCEGAAARRRLRERTSPLPEVFLFYAAGWLSASVLSLSLSAAGSDAMTSVT